ncbi:hypothetical protein HCH_00255 [Hahella chejuensis KCTC 2396]|uniref:Uncharacterized protein n=1 Tax=Hahella chejuensis (strain KCTC 2396) TaxID=349521 RepID=Q2SQA6_HAHCH|nr:hypothetical protein HCH_00255 [Hahella chejuensis KCTC 2396]
MPPLFITFAALMERVAAHGWRFTVWTVHWPPADYFPE